MGETLKLNYIQYSYYHITAWMGRLLVRREAQASKHDRKGQQRGKQDRTDFFRRSSL